ncbi:Shikimate kinase [Penicillium bovifimosum]|uniref:gluconokinase n=1 Tax=Penicillium bovifimosum TaxID=126998 RepID=A0A9W9H6J7_9EURO|nr:Shikimate kinase [Penicillium bovifimosum]KAJ5138621.1 Shikimate kinase [Penicillium bovifimosum]
MLSAGERPQPCHAVDSTPASKADMTDLANGVNGVSKPSTHMQHIWVVTGPAGCGKSTVGNVLRTKLNLPFIEGDDVIPPPNQQRKNEPRHPPHRRRSLGLAHLPPPSSHQPPLPIRSQRLPAPAGVVVACSALKQKYRDVMRVAAYGSPAVQIHFVYLKLDEKVLMQRVSQRREHYMKSTMVQSQLAVLEEPNDEWDAITINVEGPMEEVQQNVITAVTEKLAEYK